VRCTGVIVCPAGPKELELRTPETIG